MNKSQIIHIGLLVRDAVDQGVDSHVELLVSEEIGVVQVLLHHVLISDLFGLIVLDFVEEEDTLSILVVSWLSDHPRLWIFV